VLARLLYIPVMLIGGLHFCPIGTVLGTIVFFALAGIAEGKLAEVLRIFASDGVIMIFCFGAIYGGPLTFATGMVAGPLRLHIGSQLLFAAIMAPIGAVTTAIYLLIPGPFIGIMPPGGLAILTGAVTAFCCALPYGFLAGARAAPSSSRG